MSERERESNRQSPRFYLLKNIITSIDFLHLMPTKFCNDSGGDKIKEFARAIHIDIHIDMAVSDWMFDSSVQFSSVDGLFCDHWKED